MDLQEPGLPLSTAVNTVYTPAIDHTWTCRIPDDADKHLVRFYSCRFGERVNYCSRHEIFQWRDKQHANRKNGRLEALLGGPGGRHLVFVCAWCAFSVKLCPVSREQHKSFVGLTNAHFVCCIIFSPDSLIKRLIEQRQKTKPTTLFPLRRGFGGRIGGSQRWGRVIETALADRSGALVGPRQEYNYHKLPANNKEFRLIIPWNEIAGRAGNCFSLENNKFPYCVGH